MKKLLFCSFFLFVAQWLMAADNTGLRHARQKAAGFWGTTPVKLVATATGETPAYYVFNAQRTEKGFVIVAGRDNSTILGYSDNGEFDPANMPPQLQDMLDAYSEMVAAGGSNAAATQRAPEMHDAIAPLITTKWGQQAPYNKLLPNNPVTSEQFKHTGCVATAMAQIMKFYASSTATQPIPSYTYYLSKDGSTASSYSPYSNGYTVSPQGLPSTQFNYDLMKDDYSAGYTEEEGNAVAKLMLYCAQAAKMMYKNPSSGATTSSEYFSDYFGYSEDHNALSRSDYSAYEWDRLLYNELKENRPVLMSGHKPTGGHAFICDGYKNGMFHFNWGWNGSYEGYFNLAEMNPYGTGDGDAAGRDGYSLKLRAFINLRPTGADVPTNTALTLNDMYVVNSGTRVDSKVYTRSSSSEAFTVNIMQTVTNNTGSQRDFKVAYRPYKNVDGKEESVTGYTYVTMKEFPNWSYANVQFTITFPSGTYPDGTYYIRGLSNLSTASILKKDINAYLYYIKVVIEGNTLTAYSASKVENMTFNSVTLEGSKKVNREMVARASVTNNGNVPTSTAYLFVDGKMTTGVGVYVDPGETGEVVMHFMPTTSGPHDLKIYNTDETSGTLLWSGTVDISERQEPDLSVTSWTIANREGYNIKGTTFKLTITVKNNAAEAYDDVVTFKLCKKASLDTTKGTIMQTKTQDVSIPTGSSKNIEVSFDDLVIGGYYFVNTYVYKPSTESDLTISGTGTFTIIEDPTGIETITTAPAEQAQKEVYDLNGRRIGTTGSRLSKGIYIVGGKKHVVK